MENKLEFSDEELHEFMLLSRNDSIEQALDNVIEHARFMHNRFLKGEQQISGYDVLGEFLKAKTIPIEVFWRLTKLIDNPKADYTINIT